MVPRNFRPLQDFLQGIFIWKGRIEIMKEKLSGILDNALHQIEESGELDKLNYIRVAFLGKMG